MKMISSTSITSTRGVTLMSAIGPPPELLENAMVVLPRLWGGHEAHLADTGLADVLDDVVDDLVPRDVVGADVDLRLRRALGRHRQARVEHVARHRLVVPVGLAVRRHRDGDRRQLDD